MGTDWYARNLYIQGSGQFDDHEAHYGHPSKLGYKDRIPLWKAEKWDPARLMRLYKKAEAKYFVSMGSHHDNFFLWNIAGTYVRPEHVLPAPMVSDASIESSFSVLPLEDLVKTKLVAWRDKDRVHLRDLIEVGLLDNAWPARFEEPLRARLKEVLDNPE